MEELLHRDQIKIAITFDCVINAVGKAVDEIPSDIITSTTRQNFPGPLRMIPIPASNFIDKGVTQSGNLSMVVISGGPQ